MLQIWNGKFTFKFIFRSPKKSLNQSPYFSEETTTSSFIHMSIGWPALFNRCGIRNLLRFVSLKHVPRLNFFSVYSLILILSHDDIGLIIWVFSHSRLYRGLNLHEIKSLFITMFHSDHVASASKIKLKLFSVYRDFLF